MTFRALTTCSFSSRPVRGPAASPAQPRSSVRRAATLVTEKLKAPEGVLESEPAGSLSDSEFLEELRAEAARRSIAAPALALEDVYESLPAEAVAVAGAAPLATSGQRSQRRQRPRLRRRTQRTHAAGLVSGAGAARAPCGGAAGLKKRFISREDEVKLCAAVKRGAELEAVRQQLGGALEGVQPDVGEWAAAAGEQSVEALQTALVAAEHAKAALVTAHIGFLHKLAYRFKNRGLADEDLLRVAADGLVYAAASFGEEHGVRLLTYAGHFIWRDLTAALRTQVSAVTVPWRTLYDLRAMRRVESRLMQQLGRAPTSEELVAEVGCTEAKARQLEAAGRAVACVRWESLGRSGRLGDEREAGEDAISPDDLAGAVPEPDEAPQLRAWESESLKEVLELAVELLPHALQRRALQLRYGLLDGRARTFDQVATDLRPRRSKETVRQLVLEGMANLEAVLARLRLMGVVKEHVAGMSSELVRA